MWLCLFGPVLFDLFIPSSRTQNPERPRKTDRVPDGGTEQHRAAVGPHREAELGSHRADWPASEFILTSTSAAVKIAARPLG